ncbi:MAG: hypothetical protein ACRDSO_09115 [Pseudonocardiaceae bacterium]
MVNSYVSHSFRVVYNRNPPVTSRRVIDPAQSAAQSRGGVREDVDPAAISDYSKNFPIRAWLLGVGFDATEKNLCIARRNALVPGSLHQNTQPQFAAMNKSLPVRIAV